jgi:hypothetical protein
VDVIEQQPLFVVPFSFFVTPQSVLLVEDIKGRGVRRRLVPLFLRRIIASCRKPMRVSEVCREGEEVLGADTHILYLCSTNKTKTDDVHVLLLVVTLSV